MSTGKRLAREFSRMGSRLRRHAPSLVLAATAAGLAFLVAQWLFGPEEAVFAPVAAVVSTGLSAGQRRRRAVEISTGVVLGILAATLLSRWLGTGAWQLSLAVLLAMSAAVAFRASGLLSNQAAVAATVVMILVPLLDSNPWLRLGDALVGGVVAVLLTSFFAPDPVRSATRAVDGILGRYARTLEELREAVERRSLSASEDALASMESLSDAGADLSDAVAASRERIRLNRSRTRAEQRRRMQVVRLLASRMELLLTSGRALCRAGANLIRHPGTEYPALTTSLGELAGAVREIRRWTHGDSDAKAVRDEALSAAVTASSVYARHPAPAVSVLIGQVRSAVVDLLRITGLTQAEAVGALEAAAGRADRHDGGTDRHGGGQE